MSNIMENLKLYFPLIVSNSIGAKILNSEEVVVELYTGELMLYDDVEKTIRRLPSNDEDISEESYKIEFGYRLRKLMTRKSVTQEELSTLTGIPRTMISSYITGRNIPSFYKVDRIARALKCSTDELRYITD